MNQQAGNRVQQTVTQNAPVPAPQRKPGVLEYTPFNSKVKIELTVKMVQDYLCKPTKSGAVCSDVDATRFIKLCEARGLNPWEGDAFLVGYDGQKGPEFSLITAHQAFLKRAEVHPEYDGMTSGVIVRDAAGDLVDREGDFFLEDDTLLGGWATVFFKGRSHPMTKRLSLSKFHKGNKFWNENAGGMICKCAEADALRSSFPNLLGGMYLRDEMNFDQQVEGQSRVTVDGSISDIMPNLKPNSPPVGKSQPTPRQRQPKVEPTPEPEPTPEAEDLRPETLQPEPAADQADQELTDRVNHHLLNNFRLPERKKALAAVNAKDGGPYTVEQALTLLGEL